MTDLDEALAAETNRSRSAQGCTAGKSYLALAGELSPEDLDKLEAALPTLSNAGIARVFSSLGQRATASQVSYHLRGDCRCPKSMTF